MVKKQNKVIDKPPPKKRGRKPKGGKIVVATETQNNIPVPEPNIVLHLRCKLSDLKKDTIFLIF